MFFHPKNYLRRYQIGDVDKNSIVKSDYFPDNIFKIVEYKTDLVSYLSFMLLEDINTKYRICFCPFDNQPIGQYEEVLESGEKIIKRDDSLEKSRIFDKYWNAYRYSWEELLMFKFNKK